MGILDPAKLAVVLIIAFLVLGPDRLPEVARRFGSLIRQASQLREHAEREVGGVVSHFDLPDLSSLQPSRLFSTPTELPDVASESDAPLNVKEPETLIIAGGATEMDREPVGLERLCSVTTSVPPVDVRLESLPNLDASMN